MGCSYTATSPWEKCKVLCQIVTHTYSSSDGAGAACSAVHWPAHRPQFGARCLAQGHLSTKCSGNIRNTLASVICPNAQNNQHLHLPHKDLKWLCELWIASVRGTKDEVRWCWYSTPTSGREEVGGGWIGLTKLWLWYETLRPSTSYPWLWSVPTTPT